MIYVVNFASNGYEKARKLNTKSAYKQGADKVYEYTLQNIDSAFCKKNIKILEKKRGCGYWLWKPYFIAKTLENAQENDWVVYADSGMYYRKNIKEYIAQLEEQSISFVSRTTKFKEKQYTKRDVFIELDCDEEKYTDSLQRAASVILVKSTEENRKIIKEWLEIAQNYHLITDETNRNGVFNYAEFIDHRHDQSIFSILCKKYDIVCNKDLFLDLAFPFKGNALLVDHHSKYGNLPQACMATVIRVVKMLYGDWKRKRA